MSDPQNGVMDRRRHIYRALYLLLSDKGDRVDWSAFTPQQWGDLGLLAYEHGIAPLVYWSFERDGWVSSAPDALHISLADAYYQSVAQNAILIQELGLIVRALEEAGIPVVVLKGAHLGPALYPELSLRPMHDLDLMVPAVELENARQTLGTLGYAQHFPVLSQGLNQRVGYHQYLGKEDSDQPGVELHWGLLAGGEDSRSAPASWFWQHTDPFQLPGGQASAGAGDSALALEPTANLIYLAAHLYLTHHGDAGRLIWLYDIHLLITRCGDRIDWELALGKAAEFGWAGALYRALRATEQDFGTPLPDGILRKIAWQNPGIDGTARGQDTQPRHHAQDTWRMLGYQSWRARLQIAWAMLFPSPAHMRWRYHPRPAWLWPLYYPYKWAGMAVDALRLLRGYWSR